VIIIIKFVCKKCGGCSTDFGPMNNLPIFTSEIYILKKEAKKRKLDLGIIPLDVFYDKNVDLYFSSSFAMSQNPCKFLVNNLCTIYEIRPWTCRMYPVVFDPFIKDFKLDRKCKYTKEVANQEISKKTIKEIFGETTYIALLEVEKHHRLLYKYLEKVFKTREIQEIKYYNKKMKVLPFFEYLTTLKIIEKEDKEIIDSYCKKN